jgi:aldose 1-epimerase
MKPVITLAAVLLTSRKTGAVSSALPKGLRRSFTAWRRAAVPFALAISSFGAAPAIDQRPFGTADGKPVTLYMLRNAAGMEVTITNYGGAVTSIKVPDRDKNFADVVLGFDSVEPYKATTSYFGALIGRYGNRIGKGRFQLDGHVYQIPTNDGANALHGGTIGFNKRIWDARDVSTARGAALELHYVSPDGEMGFPGNLDVTVRYTLDEHNGLQIEYSATTDKATVLNLTNHSYFNLAGAGSETILKHRLTIRADHFTPVDDGLIPTGVVQAVDGTPFDFRRATEIGSRIEESNDQLKLGKGYDHNFVLNTPHDLDHWVVRVEEPKSGRVMEVYTDQPAVQFYTGNFLDGSAHGVGGAFGFRSALCLETQHYPDSPNHANFPSAVLRPGERYHSVTIYRFKTEM